MENYILNDEGRIPTYRVEEELELEAKKAVLDEQFKKT